MGLVAMSFVVHRFTLGSKTDVQLGIQLVKGSAEPIMPRTRDRTLRIPGRDGEYDFGSDYRPREIALDCEFVDTLTQTELQAAIRTLAAHLVDVDGKPQDLELSFVKEPGHTYTVRYLGRLPIKRMLEWGAFNLRLTAFDPYAYEVEETDEESFVDSPHTMVVDSSGAVSTPAEIILKNTSGVTLSGFTLKRTVTE